MNPTITHFVHLSATIVGLIGVIVILVGVGHCFYNFLSIECALGKKENHNIIRARLGVYLLLGLEFLIAADILETIFKPDVQQLIILGSIVVIRTVLNYFLTKELESIEELITPQKQNN